MPSHNSKFVIRNFISLTGLALTVACVFLYIYEPPLISTLAHASQDMLIRQNLEKSKSGRIAIIDIDEASLREFGQWPWPRFLLADLTRVLHEYGAKIVVFDVIFAEPDRTSPRHIEELMHRHFKLDLGLREAAGTNADFDRLFADALQVGPVVLGCYLHPRVQRVGSNTTLPSEDSSFKGVFYLQGPAPYRERLNTYLLHGDHITLSIPELRTVGHNGFINTTADDDGIIRSSPLVWALGQDRFYPSLALEALRLDAGLTQIGIHFDVAGIVALQLGPRRLSTDPAGRLAINYRRLEPVPENSQLFRSFPTVSARTVIRRELPAEAFSNRIIFVGTSAAGLRDIRATPLTPDFSGVEIQATVVDNILAGDPLTHPGWIRYLLEIGVILLMGLFLSWCIDHGRAWLSFLLMILAALAVIKISLLLLEDFHFIYPPAPLIIYLLLIYSVLTMLKFWQAEIQKKWVRTLFGTMVSPAVLQYLEKNPDGVSLRGSKAEATMLFSDISGFTAITESLPPEQLTRLLAEYLNPMTQIIMERRGYVDKFAGDLVMAVWGIPFAVPDHALQACLAALEQQDALDRLRPLFKSTFNIEIQVRIGLNSGLVTAGNMGSDRRMQYTVVGEAVNLAARFENLNKDYGSRILIGEETRRQAGPEIETRLLDQVVPKGSTHAVRIYELLGRKNATDDLLIQTARIYEAAFEAFLQQDFQQTERLLSAALKISPQDGPSLSLQARLVKY
jgi:adenylate cyclase